MACKQKSLNNLPGEQVIYGNTAYTLLAIIIERVSGQNLNEYARKQLFLPLRMNHTYYRTDTTTVVPNKAKGYYNEEILGDVAVTSNQLTYGAGSMGSSIEDLATWSNVLNGLNPKFEDLRAFLTATETLPSGEIAKYARGVMVDHYQGFKTIHHSGYSQGGQTQILAVPDLKLAVILLTNHESISPERLSYKILDLLLPSSNSEKAPKPENKSIVPVEYNKLTGQYQERFSDMKMEIFLERDTLKAISSQGKKAITLHDIGNNKFTRANNPSVVYEFNPGGRTPIDLTVYFGGTPFYFSRATFIDPTIIKYQDYTGHFYSMELDVTYRIYSDNNVLYLDYPHHQKVKLHPGQKDEFGNGQRVLYQFTRDVQGNVTGLLLSAEGTVKQIEFIKK